MRTSAAWLIVVGVVVEAFSCTAPNPRSCADGACTDPSLPFCDVDGAIGGTPDTCIAVACTPNEHASCRGDVAIRCNADGTNYDMLQCPLGCSDVIGGCTTCMTSDQCSNPTPFCEPASQACRACRVDGECGSQLCDQTAGTCLAVSEVVYAAPAAGDTDACSQAMPCSLNRAIELAVANPLRSTIRMAPGTYTTPIRTTTGNITIVGEGATVASPSTSSSIARGSDVKIRGLRFNLTGGQLLCGGDGTSPATMLGGILNLQDVEFQLGENTWHLAGCTATARGVTIGGSTLSGGSGVWVSMSGNSSLSADQLRVNGTISSPIRMLTTQSTLRVTNSVFHNARIHTANTGSQIDVAYSTLAVSDNYPALFAVTGNTITLKNNIFVTTAGTAVDCTNCTVTNNISFPQGPAMNMIVDPQLIAPATGDYHLKPTSPAIDAAVPLIPATTHDFDGAVRPQGAAPDIGAFERTP